MLHSWSGIKTEHSSQGINGTRKLQGCLHFLLCHVVTVTKMEVKLQGICALIISLAKMAAKSHASLHFDKVISQYSSKLHGCFMLMVNSAP